MPTPEAEGSKTQTDPGAPQAAQPQGDKAAPMEGTVPAAPEAQGGGKDKPGQEKDLAASLAQDGELAEPGQEKNMEEAGEGKAELAPAAPEPWGAGKAEKEASAAQHPGGQGASPEEVPAATKAQDGGKNEPGKERASAAGKSKGGKGAAVEGKAPAGAKAQDGGKKPREEKASAAGECKGEQAVPAEGKAPDAARAQDGGNNEPRKEQTPEGGGKAKPMEEKALAAKEAEGGKAKSMEEEAALAAAQVGDGGKEEPPKEKVSAAGKAQDAGKKTVTAEKSPADKKPAKEKGPGAAKAQDGEKAAAKTEKAPAAKKPQDRSKEDPAKEKVPAPAKAQDNDNKVAKAEKAPAAKKAEAAKEKALAAGDGGKEGAEAKPPPAAAEAGDGGQEATEAAKVEKQQSKGTEPPRPSLLQSLSCPAGCQREEQPWMEVMEMIPEETTVVEPREGLAVPGPAPPAPGDLQPPSTLQERTLPSATGQPGPEEQPPPSPYLTPDFGKEDPSEILDDVPPPPAPFAHRIVTLRSATVSSQFNLDTKDILGGGKFGEVHTCTEKQTGLKLAAKVIRKQGAKDKEMVLLEIDVMNQLNHHNLIQLYDAIETPREIILFMEFQVLPGQLFSPFAHSLQRSWDCPGTILLYEPRICEGIRFMHHMRVLHLDLKPENILCVAAVGHMVKIIDFGLARRYNPQEKLKVNFGTPEFLSPEVVNYEQVSYATDMWSLGVITYMLLSGLSPFLGDNDTETLNNVLAANWYFDEETFESVSDEAKDFVSNLIIKEKSGRMSAAQCLEHPWLNNLAEKAKRCNRRLKSQVLLKKYVMRRRWKKNFIGVCAANRFRKITSSGSLTALGV
ncbi:MYLK2 kinase, partial [Ramphastos sulfuratus]|nr:MYLK2 kinase [Ramphastos sulfuratus]